MISIWLLKAKTDLKISCCRLSQPDNSGFGFEARNADPEPEIRGPQDFYSQAKPARGSPNPYSYDPYNQNPNPGYNSQPYPGSDGGLPPTSPGTGPGGPSTGPGGPELGQGETDGGGPGTGPGGPGTGPGGGPDDGQGDPGTGPGDPGGIPNMSTCFKFLSNWVNVYTSSNRCFPLSFVFHSLMNIH